MPGNVNISSSGETEYISVEPIKYSTATGYQYGNNYNMYPNIFHDFGEVDFLTVNEKGHIDKTYENYMFEFTALRDNPTIKIVSTRTLYWPVVPEFLTGHKYQISELNGIVLFAEVAL